jgi:hypothetical protein
VFQRSSKRSRLGLASAAVVALLVLSASSVAADTTPGGDGTFSQTGTSAEAYSGECSSNGDDTTTCSETGLNAFVGKMTDSVTHTSHTNQLCAYLATYTYDDATGDVVGSPVFEQGCAVDLPSSAIQIGSGLSSVSVRPTTISVEEQVCDEYECVPVSSRTISVDATWTGIGPVFTSKTRNSGDDGTCRYSDSGKGSSREATIVGSVDGQGFGADGFAYLSSGKFTFRSRCSEA